MICDGETQTDDIRYEEIQKRNLKREEDVLN